MNILLTNDDGYNKIGIEVLKEVLTLEGHNVYIAAPLKEQSGASFSLTINKNINIERISDDVVAVDGTPIDSVYVGRLIFKNIKFDLAISGINNGLNEGIDTWYSGTIGAGMFASFAGLDTIILSASKENINNLKDKTKYILDFIFKNNLIKKYHVLNVNYPICEINEIKGVKVGRLYNIPKIDYPEIIDENTFITGPYRTDLYNELDSDRWTTSNGYYSITPLKETFENTDLIKDLEEEIKKCSR